MNEKEISELRRQLRPDRHAIGRIYGCYVSETKEIIHTFDQSMGLMTQEESETYLALLKKCMSGTIGRNLIDVSFSTRQVADSDEHRLLMTLRDSRLKDEEARTALYQKIVSALNLEGNYLILLGCNAYDVPFKSGDDSVMAEASDQVFTYIMCSICPVKKTKAGLGYDYTEKSFHNFAGDWLVSNPHLGFLFPAFDRRSTNLYHALYYTRDTSDSHEELVDAIFKTQVAKPAAEQKRSFDYILSSSLEEECSLGVVRTVQEQVNGLVAMHKESKLADPLTISRSQVQQVLQECGVSENKVAAFNVKFDSEFGTGSAVSPTNIVDTRHLELRTPDVVIQVNPDRGDLIHTKLIGGTQYIMIRADEGVEVNGVPIQITRDE